MHHVIHILQLRWDMPSVTRRDDAVGMERGGKCQCHAPFEENAVRLAECGSSSADQDSLAEHLHASSGGGGAGQVGCRRGAVCCAGCRPRRRRLGFPFTAARYRWCTSYEYRYTYVVTTSKCMAYEHL